MRSDPNDRADVRSMTNERGGSKSLLEMKGVKGRYSLGMEGNVRVLELELAPEYKSYTSGYLDEVVCPSSYTYLTPSSDKWCARYLGKSFEQGQRRKPRTPFRIIS